MYSNDKNFRTDAYENNGKFKIYPLSDEGYENYLSKDSYNYHYLKSKYDPQLLKEVEQEMKAEREKKLQIEREKMKQLEEKQKESIKEVKPSTNNEEKQAPINKNVTNPQVNKANQKNTNVKKNASKQLPKMNNTPHMPKISNIKDNRRKNNYPTVQELNI